MFDFIRRIKESLLSSGNTISFTLGENNFFAQSYANYVREGYAKNPVLFACMDYIANCIAGLKWTLYDGDETNSKRQRIDNDPILDLVQHPDPKRSYAEYCRRLVLHLYLEGDTFEYMNTGSLDAKGLPKALNILRPDRVTIENGIFCYTLDTGQQVQYPMDSIIRTQFYNPLDDFDGFSPLQAAARSVDVNNAGRQWNLSTIKNSIKAGVWFEVKDELGGRKDLMENKIREKFGGDSNAGKSMILTGGMTLKQGNFSPQDMDWKSGSAISALEILQVLHFPPELLGIAENRTYSNYKEARKSFYEETLLPVARYFRDSKNKYLLPRFTGGKAIKFLDFDISAIGALKEEENVRIDRIIKQYQAGIITHPEARTQVGYEPLKPSEFSLLYSPPINADTSPTPQDVTPITGKSLSPEEKARRVSRYQLVESYRKQFVDYFSKVAQEQFTKEKDLIAARVKNSTTQAVEANINHLIQADFVPAWAGKLAEFYTRVALTIGEKEMQGILSLKKSAKADETPRFDPLSTETLMRIKRLVGEKVKLINSTTKRQLKNIIEDAIGEGLSIDDIASQIDDLYVSSIIPNRSEVIARTETISTVNFAGQEVARQSGLNLKKEWISTIDGRTRGSKPGDEFDHLHMNGVQEVMELPYHVSGEEMMFPGDSSMGATAGNVIQCRCAEAYITIE